MPEEMFKHGANHVASRALAPSALKRRLAAAAVLLPVAVVWALLAPPIVFALLGAALIVVAAWEWMALSGLLHVYLRAAAATMVLVLLGLGWWIIVYWSTATATLLVLFSLFWLLAVADLQFGRIHASRAFFLMQGLLVVTGAWFAFVALRLGPDGPSLVLALLAMVWAADAGAYFVGRRWGQRRLAPRLSPGKTWEGLGGGLVGALIAACIASLWCQTSLWVLLALAAVLTLFSVVGDLLESRLKRAAGAKDSGRLIPGHGGVLDRLDSLFAAAPVFVLGIQIASWTR